MADRIDDRPGRPGLRTERTNRTPLKGCVLFVPFVRPGMAPLTAVKLPVLSVLSGDPWQPLGAVVGGIAARLARRLRERQQRRCFRSPDQLELRTKWHRRSLPSRVAGRRVKPHRGRRHP